MSDEHEADDDERPTRAADDAESALHAGNTADGHATDGHTADGLMGDARRRIDEVAERVKQLLTTDRNH